MKNVWKMLGGAVIGGIALGYCGYQETYTSKTEPNLERTQKPAPSTKPRPPRRSYFSHPRSENQELEEARERIREDEEEERPWYDLPEEERNFQSREEVLEYYDEALNANDYTVAETYIKDILQFYPEHERGYQASSLATSIISHYREYVRDISFKMLYYSSSYLRNYCESLDYNSTYRKVLWMDFFLINHQDVFPIRSPFDGDRDDLTTLIERGERTLEAVTYCHEELPYE